MIILFILSATSQPLDRMDRMDRMGPEDQRFGWRGEFESILFFHWQPIPLNGAFFRGWHARTRASNVPRCPKSLPKQLAQTTEHTEHTEKPGLSVSSVSPNPDIYRPKPLISTAASARCKHGVAISQLFQQFVGRGDKPLKRLKHRPAPFHRAEATVSIRRRRRARNMWALKTPAA